MPLPAPGPHPPEPQPDPLQAAAVDGFIASSKPPASSAVPSVSPGTPIPPADTPDTVELGKLSVAEYQLLHRFRARLAGDIDEETYKRSVAELSSSSSCAPASKKAKPEEVVPDVGMADGKVVEINE